MLGALGHDQHGAGRRMDGDTTRHLVGAEALAVRGREEVLRWKVPGGRVVRVVRRRKQGNQRERGGISILRLV